MAEFLPPLDFQIAFFRFLFRVTQPIALPDYKGSTFHDGFGQGLSHIGRRFGDYFFRPSAGKFGNKKETFPKPFMLIPPLERKTLYSQGDGIQCGLILFGEAIGHFMIAFAALERLGQELGLGENKGRFRIEFVEQLTLDGSNLLFEDDRWYSNPPPVRAREVLAAHHGEARQVVLSLVTRLRLKHNNLLVRKPPPFPVLFDRLIGRINSISRFYGSGMMIPSSEKTQLMREAESVKMDRSRTTARWEEWDRPQKPGRSKMTFGGLLGEIGYSGELGPFVPWLALGQWTGVGGKTSFGLGFYHLNFDRGGDEIEP